MSAPVDLSAEMLARALPGRAVRTYPALLSTEADAMAWARAGAPGGALVVADYQASPRGRGGLEWMVRPGEGLGFSLVLRPGVESGWVYAAASCALAETLGAETMTGWPDEVHRDHEQVATVGVYAADDSAQPPWTVLTAHLTEPRPPRDADLAELIGAVEARLGEQRRAVLDAYRARCATLGRAVVARLIPMGPNSKRVSGTAADVDAEGALVVEETQGRRAHVRAQDLGVLEYEADPAGDPDTAP